MLSLPHGLNILAQKKVGCNIQGISKQQVADLNDPSIDRIHVDLLMRALKRPTIGHCLEQGLHVRLECVKVTNPVLDELRPDHLPAVMPALAIRGKDAVPQKGLPLLVERLAFPVVCKLSSQDGLDVLRTGGKEDSPTYDGGLACPGIRAAEELAPLLQVFVVYRGLHACCHDIESCAVVSWSNHLYLSCLGTGGNIPKGSFEGILGARMPIRLILILSSTLKYTR